MAVLIDDDFASGITGWSAGSHNAAIERPDWTLGALDVAAGVTAERTFTAETTGQTRLDLYWRDDTTTTAAGGAANGNVYLMLSNQAVSSANAAAYVSLSRDTTVSPAATSETITLGYRDGTGFAFTGLLVPRGAGSWHKVSVVVRHAESVWDLYLDDTLLLAGLTHPASFSGYSTTGKVAVSGNASAPTTSYTGVRLETQWSLPAETTLIDHVYTGGSGQEIEAVLPGTDLVNLHPQYPRIPDDTTYGGFDLQSDGARPDASKVCQALYRCGPEGIYECEFVAASTGTIYFGAVWRLWDGQGSDAYYLARVSGTGANNFVLFGGNGTALASQATASVTVSAGNTYTLKIEARGRVFRVWVKAAAMDSGSYSTPGITHTITSAATGGRGLLSEDLAGPYLSTSVGDRSNRVVRFRYTGRVQPAREQIAIGDASYVLEPGSIKELYHAGTGTPTANKLWSRGFQFLHRSTADVAESYDVAQRTIFDATDVKSYQQRGNLKSEVEYCGLGDGHVTFTRRGVWISDRITAYEDTQNLAPDHDFWSERWEDALRWCGDSGSSTAHTLSGFADWAAWANNVALPLGFQRLAAGSGSRQRLTVVSADGGNLGGTDNLITYKRQGNGFGTSIATGCNPAGVASGTAYTFARAILHDLATALSASLLEGWRDDVAAPATLSATTGAAKTDADGDDDEDGFNERFGWYEWDASGGAAAFEIPGARYRPQVRIHGLSATAVTLGGSPAVAGTDYWLSDLGDGSHLLGLAADYADGVEISLEAAASGRTTKKWYPGLGRRRRRV